MATSKGITPQKRPPRSQNSQRRVMDRWAKTLLDRQLQGLTEGAITLRESFDDTSARHYGQASTSLPVSVGLDVLDPGFYSDTVFGGSVGAAEAYMAGYWTCSDLVGLVRILVRNREVLDGLDTGVSLITTPLRALLHLLNRNTREGSRRNIAAHYDLGNDFFRLFLDETLMYSCAVFSQPEMSLHHAQLTKLDLICRRLNLKPDDHLLEIGTGWGGFALHAATHYGCRVTTTTISEQQYQLAAERIAAAGLSDRITLLKQDYRDLQGCFDKLVSIEMIEAVGHQYYPIFFKTCGRLLKPDGLMLLQAITINDRFYRRARDEVDFIKRHIFPGSCIPSITALVDASAQASDLQLTEVRDIGPHYATTLRRWREAFMSQLDAVRAQGYPEEFIRLWEFYLAYCEGGYTERVLGDLHMVFNKPLFRD
ncbi:MAG: class I SAM-dependent methyltransferase [Methylococcaceae bacterium]|jgi:cyclopropane-fatty-acyl-phospholipid synthase